MTFYSYLDTRYNKLYIQTNGTHGQRVKQKHVAVVVLSHHNNDELKTYVSDRCIKKMENNRVAKFETTNLSLK